MEAGHRSARDTYSKGIEYMHTTYNRRQAIGIGLASLASLSGLAACDTSAQPVSSGPISLRMFFWGSATRDKLTRQTIGLFHQSNQNITITSSYSGNNTYYIKLNAQIASNNTPDLIQMDMRYIAQYVRQGRLLDLSQFIYDQTIDLTDFDPILLDSSKVNNSIYGIPLGSNYQCMFYDQTLIEKAGLGPLPQGMTWEMFAAYTAELSNILGNGTYGTADSSGNYDNFEIWIRQRGKELYTVDGKLAFTLTDAADWYNYWDGLRKAHACPPMNIQSTLDLTGTPTDSSVIKGKAVFSHLFTNQYEAFHKASPHTLALSVFPLGKVPGIYLKASQLLSISTVTKNSATSADFVNFVTNDPGALETLGFERGVPGAAHGRALLAPHATPAQKAITTFMDQIANTGAARQKEVLDPPAAGQIADILLRVSQEIGFGKISVSDGAKEFYTAAQKATAPS
jgi:multiple sugar transport system substrate-binding protein